MKTAVVYARYSSDKQTEQSIEGQISVCKNYAKQNNIKIIDYYIDRAMTGTNTNRPDFKKMISDSFKKKFDYVLVYKLDRFSRNRYDSVINKTILKKNNVKLLSACENITDSPEGIILESLLEGMNEYYSAELSQKIKRGVEESLKKRHYLGGVETFGYEIKNKEFIVKEFEAEIVKEIFTRYSNGERLQDIILYLKEHGIKNKKNKDFNTPSITRLLKNKKYIGIFHYGGKDYEEYLPAIIDKTLFEKVQMTMKNNKKLPPKESENYILSGKLYCGECNSLMYGESGYGRSNKKYCYYKCDGKKKNKVKCKNIAYNKDKLENVVIELTQNYILNKETRDDIITNILKLNSEDILKDTEKESLESKIKQLNKEIENLIKAIKQGIVSEHIQSELKDLENELDVCKTNLIILENNKPKLLTKAGLDLWFSQFEGLLNKKTSERLIDSLVFKIIVHENNITIVYNNSKDSPKSYRLPESTIVSNVNQLVEQMNKYSNIKISITQYYIILEAQVNYF